MNSQPASHRLVASAVLACLFAVFATATWLAHGYALKDALGPGPGFFPFWLGLIGAVLSLVLLVQSWRGGAIGEVAGCGRTERSACAQRRCSAASLFTPCSSSRPGSG